MNLERTLAWNLSVANFTPPVPGGTRSSREEGSEVEVQWVRLDADARARVLGGIRQAWRGVLSGEAGSASGRARVLGTVGERFLDPGDSLRRTALELLPPTTGLSPANARWTLDRMAAGWTREALQRLVDRTLPREAPGPDPDPAPPVPGRIPVPLVVQVLSGTVPGVSVNALQRALLAGAGTVIKPGRGDRVLPLLHHAALLEADPHLASLAAVHFWPGEDPEGRPQAEEWIAACDRLVVYGSDEACRSLRAGAPAHVPVFLHPARIGVGFVGRERLGGSGVGELAREMALALAAADGRGCVTPQLVFVEEGGGFPPAVLAEELARALDQIEEELPRGILHPEEGARLQQWRGIAGIRAALRAGDRCFGIPDRPWSIWMDSGSDFAGSCPGRTIRIRPVPSLEEAIPALVALGPQLQTAALAVGPERQASMHRLLAEAGIQRIAPFREVPWPPPTWHQDGEDPLAPFMRFVDVEGTPPDRDS